MKIKLFFLILVWGVLYTPAQKISPQFSELKGAVDYLGTEHLFYRIFSSEGNPLYNSASNSVYDLDISTMTDSVYLWDGYWCNMYMGSGINIYDYEFWDGDLKKYITCGTYVNCFEPYFFISRYDTLDVFGDLFTNINKIDISKQNDSLIFVGPMMLKSIDGGITWDTLTFDFRFLSLSPFDDNIIFAEGSYQINQSALYKSIDGGSTFNMVDTGEYWQTEFFYDIDRHHVFRYSSTGFPNVSLKVSPNQGNSFSWTTIYNSNQNFYICLDPSQSGSIYLADGKKIFRSSDYGSSFLLYKEIEQRIIGVYKKPDSDKLYVATKYKIYEITDNSITLIKSLPIPQEILAYYPLNVGNKWIYDYTWYETPLIVHSPDIFLRTVTDEVIKPNGKKYFEIKEKYILMGLENTVFERVDTTEGKVYRYEEFCPGSEQFIDDLLGEAGDSTYAARFGYCLERPPTVFASEQSFSKWGISGIERIYTYVELLSATHSLVSEVGLNSFTLSDDNGEKVYQLKGILRDGIVYGDTSLIVGINSENALIPAGFKLFQNYPNPFNPRTKIRFEIPVTNSPLSGGAGGGFVTLKVYDVLGNEVETLVNEYKPAGSYEVEFNAKNLPSGVYFYQLKVGDFIQSKKMLLIR
jgi:hypothetical protein